MNKIYVRLGNRRGLLTFTLLLLLSLVGCNERHVLRTEDESDSQRVLRAPASVKVGEAIAWSVDVAPGEEVSATVFDSNRDVVIHRSFEAVSEYSWTPFQPGKFRFELSIRNEADEIETASGTVEVLPRGAPMVTGTEHPLVALYTYTIPAGREGRVAYTCESCPEEVKARTFETPILAGTGSEVGVLLPALRPGSSYSIQHLIYKGFDLEESGPMLKHSTGAIPIELHQVSVAVPPANPKLNALLAVSPTHSFTGVRLLPQMVDELGTTVWYVAEGGTLTRPTGNGWTMLRDSAFMVIDYTGQALRRITSDDIADQMSRLGFSAINVFHHEMRPLPDDRYVAMVLTEKLFSDVQGPGEVNIISSVIVVLDDRMRVVWTWNTFDHLDLTREALLENVRKDGAVGVSLLLGDTAKDWTHSNSVDYDPKDGNLILSVRHQSWVVKIAYENGRGDGHVVWRLGREGDFELTHGGPEDWFSYQHDANYLLDGRLAIYDNGNERHAKDENATSRGQVYILDEEAMTAELVVNIDLGSYNDFIGSAAQAPDGSFHFDSGVVGRHEDFAQDGTSRGAFTTPARVYRSFRMKDPFDLSPN